MGKNWKDIAELTGIVAIILTLAFVGFQLKQDRDIAIAQLRTDAEIKQIELSNLISSHASLWARGLQGEELPIEEEVIFQAIVHAVIVKYGSLIERTDRRLLDRSGAVERQLALHLHSHPGLRRVWQARCEFYEGVYAIKSSIDDGTGCGPIQSELKKIEDGTLPAIASPVWSL